MSVIPPSVVRCTLESTPSHPWRCTSRLCLSGRVPGLVDVDYLVVGAGAMGMGFVDALIDHADVRVALIDRRDGVGGHWRHAYPFVRLHQSSTFYGVASRVLGGGLLQTSGPEAGLHERADQPTICAYYEQVLAEHMVGPGRVEFFPSCDYLGRSHVRLARVRRAVRGPRAGAGSSMPATSRPTSRRRHRRGSRSPTAYASSRSTTFLCGKAATEPVRRRRLGQDRDGRLRLAAGPRGRPRRDLLGPTARPLDAEPGADPAGSGHLPGHGGRDDAAGGRGGVAAGALPAAGGRRHHAADRPGGDPDDGQGAHPGSPGSSTCCAASSKSCGSVTSGWPGAVASTWPRDRSPSTPTR